MAQTGFTPILIYASGTSSNTPAAGNLTNSALGAELAINYADGILFYKDSGGVVQQIATKDATAGIFGGTGAITVPAGTQAQRPAVPTTGMFRFNSDTVRFEGYNGTAWASVGGPAISNDTTTSTDVYPAFLNATSGTAANIYTSNAKLLYNPSTGEFKSPGLAATNVKASVIKDLNGNLHAGLLGFYKADPSSVAFTKTGAGSAEIKANTTVGFSDGTSLTFTVATAITMPTLAAGTDYAIWVKNDGTTQATTNFTAAPSTGTWRRIGGFHYAPGGNATAQSGGNTTPQINEYSFWDLKFRPACSDPRGMTLVAGGFWVDIYLTGVDAITNGSSKYNVTMADGSSPPKVPTMFGGNGSTTYGSYTWFEAQEMSTAFGKRTLTQQEFMSAMYGTTEASSVGTDQGSTILNAAYTSKWGVVQSTGVLWIWGDDRGGAYNTAGWNANTEGRGSEYNAPNAVLLGGDWNSGSFSGSRCSLWGFAASISSDSVGSRFCCDHLQLD